LHALGIREFSLADTTGVSGPENIGQMFSALLPAFPDCRIGAHLHSTPEDSAKKISAAFESGCRRFDSALFGYGGCPMASDELTGNISTQILLHTMKNHLALPGIHQDTFREAESLAQKVFSYH
jgi:hydroxymethylglutaryl-CoA lyase